MTRLPVATALATILALCVLSDTKAFSPSSPSCRARLPATRGSTAVRFSSPNDDGDADAVSEENAKAAEPPKPAVKCPDCDLCDGSGRIPGGLGAVFPWIPIKAFRPCPNFIDRGGFYERSGQGLDEIAFGRDSTFEK